MADIYMYGAVIFLFIVLPVSSFSDSVRIDAGSPLQSQGIVEVYRNGSWQVLCAWVFEEKEAMLTCRELGYTGGSVLPPVAYGPFFSNYTEPFRGCTGNETSIVDCNFLPVHVCGHDSTNYASVNCYQDIGNPPAVPLNLTDSSYGGLSYFKSGIWGQVCLDYWSDMDATVACQEAGYGRGRAMRVEATDGQPFTLTGIHCHGNESTLAACEESVQTCYDTDRRAGVVCYQNSLSFHLRDGDDADSGRVEIEYDGQQGAVQFCGSDPNDVHIVASVFCQQLGYVTGSGRTISTDSEEVYLDILDCDGTESSILTCENRGWLNHNNTTCQSKSLYVSCVASVQLRGGIVTENVTMGMIEIYVSDRWTTLCAHDFDAMDAMVICRQLGYNHSQVLLPDLFGKYAYTFLETLGCTGREENILDCDYKLGYCKYSSHASVLCSRYEISPEFQVHLSGGDHGTVLIEMHGVNGTVCSQGWDDKDANVLCKQKGFRGGIVLGTNIIYTRYEPIWLTEVDCMGGEEDIQHCSFAYNFSQTCGTGKSDAGALCYNDKKPSVSLVGGDGQSGRVDIDHNGLVGTICDNSWSAYDARVVCQQQGFADGKPFKNSYHGKGSGLVYMDEVKCDGTESSILACPNLGWTVMSSSDCDLHRDDSGVECLPFVKISGRYYGMVQVWDSDLSNYGLICDDGYFNNTAAQVVCKALGFNYGLAVHGSIFGPMPQLSITISNVTCSGSESRLTECHYTTGLCNIQQYVSVVCAFTIPSSSIVNIKIEGGSYGHIQVQNFYQFGYICTEGFDDIDATVICKTKGYEYGVAYKHYTQTKSADILYNSVLRWLNNIDCNESASSFSHCNLRWGQTFGCDYRMVAGVFCLNTPASISISLENGTTMAGRVAVTISADTKGLVCGDYFSDSEAAVVCRHYGYLDGIALGVGSYGNGNGDYFIEVMKCNGNETNFLDCLLAPDDAYLFCKTGAAAVKCYSNVRITGSNTPDYGRVEMHNGQRWEAVCDSEFGDEDAMVVCRSLGFQKGWSQCCSALGVIPENTIIQITDMQCNGSEARPQDCPYNTDGACPSQRYASALCVNEPVSTDIEVELPEGSFYGPLHVRVYGVWGYICDTEWDDKDADVVCRSHGYRMGSAIKSFVGDKDPILLGYINCTGKEENLNDCKIGKFESGTGCYKRETIAGVICLSNSDELDFAIRGSGKSSTIYIGADNTKMYVDYTQFDDNAAGIFCRQMDSSYLGGSAFGGYVSHLAAVSGLKCDGSESSILECQGNWDPRQIERRTLASVICNTAVRLVGGEAHFGIVEAFYKNSWGTICADNFNNNDAGVVCRNLGFDTGFAVCCAPFGSSSRPIIISDIRCTGTETDITECPTAYVGANNLADSCEIPGNQASVVCYEDNQQEEYFLSLPKYRYDGDLVVTYQGVEGRLCADGWDDRDASVACRQMHFTDGIAYTHYMDNTTGMAGPYWASDVMCTGSENDLFAECGHMKNVETCIAGHYAGVICFDGLGVYYRIAGDDLYSQWGRIEVYLGETWGTICDTYWGQKEAHAVCRQFGYSTGDPFYGKYRKPPPNLVYNTKYMCTGEEDNLGACPHGGWLQTFSSRCTSHRHDAGVFCYMSVKLHNGVGRETNEGAVLLYENRHWYLVCDQGFSDKSAQVVCNELGFLYGKAECCSKYNSLPFEILQTVKISCTENDKVVQNCLKVEKCNTDSYASVICSYQPFSTPATTVVTTEVLPFEDRRKTSDDIAVTIGVVLGVIGVIAIAVAVLLFVKFRRVRKDSTNRQEFHSRILYQSGDGSVHIHNPLHGVSHSNDKQVDVEPQNLPSYDNPSYASSQYLETKERNVQTSYDGNTNKSDTNLFCKSSGENEASFPGSPKDNAENEVGKSDINKQYAQYDNLESDKDSHIYDLPTENKDLRNSLPVYSDVTLPAQSESNSQLDKNKET